MSSSYVGNAVHEANVSGLNQNRPEPKRRTAPNNRPSRELILARYQDAVERQDEVAKGIWLDIWMDSGYDNIND